MYNFNKLIDIQFFNIIKEFILINIIMVNYSELAKKEYNKGNFTVAILYYKFDIYFNNNILKYTTYYNIANIFIELNDNEKALIYIKNSIKADPNWYKSWLTLGDILNNLEKYDNSILALNRSYQLSYHSEYILKKIQKIKNKIESLKDTEEEQIIEDEIIEEELPIKTSNNKFSYSNFVETFNNTKIQNLLSDDNLKKKILESNGNPMAIFQDKDIYNLMNEMYSEYKKK